MGGLGMIFGGALSGFGAGLAKQGEMDFQQRRELALQNVRAQSDISNIQKQGEQQRITQIEKAILDNNNDANHVQRTTNSTIVINKNQNSLETVKAERMARLEAELRRTDAAAAEALKRETAAGEVSDTFQDDQGNWYVLYKNGRTKPLNIKGAPRAVAGTGGSILDRAGSASGQQPATPGAKVSISNW